MQALVGCESEGDMSSGSEGESECPDEESAGTQNAATATTTAKEPRKGTAAWWLEWREFSILPHVDTSVKRLCCMLAGWRWKTVSLTTHLTRSATSLPTLCLGRWMGICFPPATIWSKRSQRCRLPPPVVITFVTSVGPSSLRPDQKSTSSTQQTSVVRRVV